MLMSHPSVMTLTKCWNMLRKPFLMITKKREKLIIPGNKGLSDVLCNHVVTHGIGPREADLDAQVISLVSDLALEQLRNIKTDIITFDPQVFNQKIIWKSGLTKSDD
ncbi:uncharacterized protein [Dysidea avara]|uniref:uncharacterized protein n=1 Tax=Dysidea avara TaxID=196820 RepID=UPI00332AB51E